MPAEMPVRVTAYGIMTESFSRLQAQFRRS